MIDGAITIFQPRGTNALKVLYAGWDNDAANKAWKECDAAGEVAYITVRGRDGTEVRRMKKNIQGPKLEETVEDEDEVQIATEVAPQNDNRRPRRRSRV